MTEEKKVQETVAEEQNNEATTNPAEKQLPNELKEEKKGWFRNLGTGMKIGLGVAGTAIIGGLVWLVTSMLGGKDEEEPEAIEAGEDTNE